MAKSTTTCRMTDIARLAGVSLTTVSRALGGGAAVNARTRAHILDVARHCGYTKHLTATVAPTKRSRTVAVILPAVSDVRRQVSHGFSKELLACVTDELAKHGYDALLSRVAKNRDLRSTFLASGRAEGIILIGNGMAFVKTAAKGDAPLVAWGSAAPALGSCTVGSDHVTGACSATAHLLRMGRRRIVFLGDTALPGIDERYRGYVEAHRQQGLTPSPELLVRTSFDRAAAATALKALLESSVGFDAVFAISDGLAISAIELLHAQGHSVPDDVSVVGYDDTLAAEACTPRLTSVRQDARAGGRLLARALLDLLAGRRPASTVLATELVVRESCGGRQTAH
jgi:DNA-binding LacI/PurR family transcriptional regulator